MNLTRSLAALLIASGLVTPVLAQHGHDHRAHERHGAALAIENVWARATAPMAQTGAVYLTIRNGGAAADRLISVSSPAARTVELHTHIHDGNIMRMRKIDTVPVEPGKTVSFAPGGLHIMLIGLTTPLMQGSSVPLTLTFEKAGEMSMSAQVLGAGAMGPGHSSDTGGHRH